MSDPDGGLMRSFEGYYEPPCPACKGPNLRRRDVDEWRFCPSCGERISLKQLIERERQ